MSSNFMYITHFIWSFRFQWKKKQPFTARKWNGKCEKCILYGDQEWNGCINSKWIEMIWHCVTVSWFDPIWNRKPIKIMHIFARCPVKVICFIAWLISIFSLSKRARINWKLRGFVDLHPNAVWECGLWYYRSITFDRFNQSSFISFVWAWLWKKTVNEKGIWYQLEPNSLYLRLPSVCIYFCY